MRFEAVGEGVVYVAFAPLSGRYRYLRVHRPARREASTRLLVVWLVCVWAMGPEASASEEDQAQCGVSNNRGIHHKSRMQELFASSVCCVSDQ